MREPNVFILICQEYGFMELKSAGTAYVATGTKVLRLTISRQAGAADSDSTRSSMPTDLILSTTTRWTRPITSETWTMRSTLRRTSWELHGCWMRKVIRWCVPMYLPLMCCYLASDRGAKYCDERVCMSVCPLVYLKRPHSQTSQNFLYGLTVTVAWLSSDDNAICIRVLWWRHVCP